MDNQEEILMMLITYSGMAKSSALEAIDMADSGNWDKVEEKLDEAEQNMVLAGKEHFKMFDISMKEDFKFSLLLAHAEDQMLTAETTIAISRKIIRLYKK